MSIPPPSKPLALTCGDPAGIGPEVIARWLSTDALRGADCVAIGPRAWLRSLPMAGVEVGPAAYQPQPGAPDDAGALVALAALDAAAAGCVNGAFRGVVTGPVSKRQLQRIGFPHPGQTEYFAAAWGGEPVMAFAGEHLRLTLATWHVPLMQVGRVLRRDPGRLEHAVQHAHALARRLGVDAPRVAVCGLNPHAGEDGLLGDEEIDWIDPLLDSLRARLPGLSRTLPADTVFMRMLRGDFDIAVALYHDQGLAPLKTLEFDRAVNITLGLPHLRVSPDHGTAYAIAGSGRADPGSWAAAVALARRLTAPAV
jgi:4-hydroxythreonine-4-phosphate dehydrogenase